jgi:hypothetical protein
MITKNDEYDIADCEITFTKPESRLTVTKGL